MQCRKRLLRPLNISGLQRFRQLTEILIKRMINGICLRRGRRTLRAFHVMMMVVMPSCWLRAGMRDPCNLLRRLLNSRVILLRCPQIPRLQGLPQLVEFLQQRTGTRGTARCARCAGRVADLTRYLACSALANAWKVLRKRGEILLRLAQVAGLQVLPQLLEFIADLLELGLDML